MASELLLYYCLTESDASQPVSTAHLQKISLSYCTKWRFLPSALEMGKPDTVVNDIEREAEKEEERKAKFFSKWQSSQGRNATYKNLVKALLEIDCKQDAEHVCELLSSAVPSRESEGNDSTQRDDLVKENQARIKGCFASLVNKFASKLSHIDIDMSQFRSFVANLFPPGHFISSTATIAEIFDALTRHRLWGHWSYSTFELIYKDFGEDDLELRDLINKYKAELAGFKATTRIIDFIRECNDDDEIADSDQSICQDKGRYDTKYCRRLTMKLRRRITEKSLDYIDEFWKSVADNFVLPSLPIQLDRIQEGCTEISWLISVKAASKVESVLQALKFLKQVEVTKVSLENQVLYTDAEMNHAEKLKEQKRLVHDLQDSIQLKDLKIAQLQKQIEMQETVQVPHLDLQWEHGTEIPIGMDGYIQAVVVQGKVYVGGGEAGYEQDEDGDDGEDAGNCIVMEYDTASGEWDYLVPYESTRFAVTVIYDRLVLVGGLENDTPRAKLGVWVEDDMEWTFPYPDMPTGRYDCSAVVYNQWLIVAGGVGSFSTLASVNVLDIANQQWHAGPPLPQPLRSMKTSVAKDTCYFIGDGSYATYQPVCCISIESLITSIFSESVNTMDAQVWREIAEPPYSGSSPLSFSGHFYSAGGFDETGHAVSSIYQYQPDVDNWVKVGDLPSPRYFFTCATLRSSRILIVGGNDYSDNLQRSTDIAVIQDSETESNFSS